MNAPVPASQPASLLRKMFASLLFSLTLSGYMIGQSSPAIIQATVDTTSAGVPISPRIYGQFLEHAAGLVDEGVWAEMLADRKFYDPITATPPAEPAVPAWQHRPPRRRWVPVGGEDAVTMDKVHPFVGEQSPQVTLDGETQRGFEQTGLTVEAGKAYTGRIYLSGSPTAVVKVALVWGSADTDRQTVLLRGLGTAYRRFPLRFTAQAGTGNATLKITGTGSGSFHVGTVSLMPADNLDGFRPEVVAALKQLRSGVYRFPGGNFVSAYEWRYGVGPVDKRPPVFDPVWHYTHSNDVGTDEFLTLCRLLGVEPYITVNAGFGDAWSARQLVEYTNGAATTPMGRWRAANGHPAPYGVKLWGIGNEPWGDYQMGAMSPEQFALKHVLFAKAMREVDPSITLVAGGAMPDVMVGANQAKRIGGKFIPDYLSPSDWSGYMLVHDLPYINMLSEHYYASGSEHTDLKLEKKTPWTPPNLVEWERAAATQVRVKFEHYEEYLKLIPALRENPIPVAIDEWAYMGGTRDGYKVVPAYAWAMHEMFRHSDVFQMACFTFATSTLSQGHNQAVLNPTGLLFKLYRDHFGTIPVVVTGNSPQPAPVFPAGGDQPAVNPGSPTYPLDVSAALTADRKSLTVAVLNPSDSEQHIQLSVRGANLAAGGQLWQMAPSDLNAVNKVGEPAQVKVEQRSTGSLAGVLAVPRFSVNVYVLPLQ